ncbi:CPBP family intramembrane glutamic endopeptidase [Treponema sp.]|uniref:CPBP family intramembrane glutamic endopeptidase n=1 Tax=Treponema sp. TaxID=166 RepID=UPI00298E113B|nr:CPBP family intramembrane glutamic endopeptidase [Treponema sp.]MCR5612809.1 CPBP family intramembrane metalloprotease [Treponema sp.]
MKKRFLYLELLLLCTLFIIPPIFTKSIKINENTFSFSWFIIAAVLVAFVLFFQFEYENLPLKNASKIQYFVFAGKVFFYFGFLIIFHIIFVILSLFLPADIISKLGPQTDINLKFSAPKIILILFTFLCSAFYEEVMYRLYLPEIIKKFCGTKAQNKIISYLIEFICITIFALAHRYLGILAVVNAFIGGIILRLEYLKTKTVLCGTVSHFLYNSTILLVGALL